MIASLGIPWLKDLRVLTSQKTKVDPFCATMSNSTRLNLQLRSRIS